MCFVGSEVEEIAKTKTVEELRELRNRLLGKKSQLAQDLAGLGKLAPERRRAEGERLNRYKRELEAALDQRERSLAAGQLDTALERERLDVTLPGRSARVGRHHPITATIRELTRIFAGMGFEAVEGPEVEWDYYNFEALNIPRDHPAREKYASLWVSNPLGDDPRRPMLLRTHTSPMQARIMEQRKPPVRVIVPGRCFRYEATDPTHESIFFQFEGLAIDDRLTMADLKGVLYSFARQMFGGDRKIRFRNDYFPFVEPGADVAVDCFVCDGKRCRTCGYSGWIELLGAGMVHPNVLRAVGYDPDRYQGFAFGGGVERLSMLRQGVSDLRAFQQNDVRWLSQFGQVS
ncbi:MAG: phenylalanine--tRNA ligase subunit alpha [Chloroflexi bacterium 13_1_40CM_4_68_4]|nr:MAG: phenylalanine--tRNA ligase subunit alpha [Chloroflexi bacterium 13_1_40CM_4_68_4]